MSDFPVMTKLRRRLNLISAVEARHWGLRSMNDTLDPRAEQALSAINTTIRCTASPTRRMLRHEFSSGPDAADQVAAILRDYGYTVDLGCVNVDNKAKEGEQPGEFMYVVNLAW